MNIMLTQVSQAQNDKSMTLLIEVPRIIKFTETEQWLLGWLLGGVGYQYLTGTEFLFGIMTKFWK